MTPKLIGLAEIAELLEVEQQTVYMWRHRGLLPVPYSIVNGRPCWLESVILGWAVSTGRAERKEPARTNQAGSRET